MEHGNRGGRNDNRRELHVELVESTMTAPCVVVVVGRLWVPAPDGRKIALSGALGIEWSAGFDSAKP